jgi:archaeal flagellar protein FlaJ
MASISSSTSSQRPASGAPFKAPSEFDLFFQLIYMSAVASAGVSRNMLFQLASKLVRAPAVYFQRIHLLCEKLGYNYPAACNVVGLKAKSEAMKVFLLRFADALKSGHPEVTFLTQEANVQRDAYEKDYERNLTSLAKWTDAFGAIIVSASLIIIVNLTSTMIHPLSTGVIVALVLTAILATSGGAWVISRAAPCEPEAIMSSDGPVSQRQAMMLAKISPVAVVIVCGLLALVHVSTGWLLTVAGVLLLPVGITSSRAAKEIEKKDRDIGPFLRSLGAVSVSTGSTLSQALDNIDISSFPALQNDIARLSLRFKAAIAPALCWRKFARETGSRLITEAIRIFYDAIQLGGEADMVGSLCSQFATTEVLLRARRKVIAATFTNLTVVMHLVVAALMLIILEVIKTFSALINAASATVSQDAMASMGTSILSFSTPMLTTLSTLTYAMVVLLAFINAYAIVAADGGHILKGSMYLSVMSIMSGACFLFVPPFVRSLLKAG